MSALQRINYIIAGNCNANVVKTECDGKILQFIVEDVGIMAEYDLDRAELINNDLSVFNDFDCDDGLDAKHIFRKIEPLMQQHVNSVLEM